MIALDTNVLVRFLVADDEGQTEAATGAIEGAAEREEGLFLGSVVLCELVWVLESAYGYGREALADVLETLLLTRQFTFEDRSVTWRALARYRDGSADFADFMVGEVAHSRGCSHTLTLDANLDDEDGFEVLQLGE